MNESSEAPRAYTTEEVKAAFLGHCRTRASYWIRKAANGENIADCIHGAVFSVLTAIDGVTNLPGFILAPNPAASDRAFHVSEGESYYPENDADAVHANISGSLHDDYFPTPCA